MSIYGNASGKSGPVMVVQIISFILLSMLSSISMAADDSDAMAQLAATLQGTPSSWSTNSSSYCQWIHVSCDISGRVTAINLEDMELSGSLPPEINSLSHLNLLSITNTNVSGVIPRLDNLISLRFLFLSNNSFTSFAPGFFQRLPTRLEELIMYDNPLASWTLPAEFGRLTNLTDFFAGNTNLMGPLPDIFESFPLLILGLSNNNLSGSLPASFGKSNIQNLFLNNQKTGLSGTIQVLSCMTHLNQVQLEGNQFTGPIPEFFNSTTLEVLSLDNNQLTGVVPQYLGVLPKGRVTLSNNKLQGPFPKFLLPHNASSDDIIGNNFCTKTGELCDAQIMTLLEIASALGYPLALAASWKGNDACQNWSYVSCNSHKEIIEVNFGWQSFGGTISPAFANLTALKFLFLNGNNLTGSIPQELTKLPHLQILDVSNNNLIGNIPAFDSSVNLTTTGNNVLVKNPSVAPPARKPKGKRKGSKFVIVVLLVMGTVSAGVCLFILGTWSSKLAGNKKIEVFDVDEAKFKVSTDNILDEKEIQANLREIRLLEFERLAAATNNFDSANKLGQGGFGPVYKGKLKNGQEIAVKRLWRAFGQGAQEFMNEVVVISKLQHKNLVRLLGCCIEEQMLVYEYMPNKSLDCFLFDPQKQKLLDWRKRFNIIEGICCGLLYLHRDSRPRIIHRDLKASNILLDEQLNPKISDFGIARIFNSTCDQANTRRVVGTYGYMPPEYVKKGRFSEKSDIFSFGVLILEIVSGRTSVGVDHDEHSWSILEHAWTLWNAHNISVFIDPLILNLCFQKDIIRCIHVGLLCVQEHAKDRPIISTVISMLSSEIENLPAPKQPAFVEEATAIDTFQTVIEDRKDISEVRFA